MRTFNQINITLPVVCDQCTPDVEGAITERLRVLGKKLELSIDEISLKQQDHMEDAVDELHGVREVRCVLCGASRFTAR